MRLMDIIYIIDNNEYLWDGIYGILMFDGMVIPWIYVWEIMDIYIYI